MPNSAKRFFATRVSFAFCSLALVLALAISMAGCDGDTDDEVSTQNLELIDRISLSDGETSDPYLVTVPDGASSLTIIADGSGATDLDISALLDPTGFLMISSEFFTDPIGRNSAQWPGQSAVSFTVPHSGDYTFNTGDWAFEIKNAQTPYYGLGAKSVSVYTIVKHGLGSRLDVNVWIVALPDYQGEDDPHLAIMLDEFARLMSLANIAIGDVKHHTLTGGQAERLTYPDMAADTNFNQQPDDLDELFALSSRESNDYINLFFVRNISGNILGIAGGIPGIPLLQGTPHSGLVISTLGGFTQMSPKFLIEQGVTIAHEVGHYLGLFHPTERSGRTFDPISDTPECDIRDFDTNGDGIISATECESTDGANLMFYSDAPYAQETFSAMQENVMRVNPAVK